MANPLTPYLNAILNTKPYWYQPINSSMGFMTVQHCLNYSLNLRMSYPKSVDSMPRALKTTLACNTKGKYSKLPTYSRTLLKGIKHSYTSELTLSSKEME